MLLWMRRHVSSRKPQKALKLKGGFKNDAKGDTKKKEETKVDAADEIAQANAPACFPRAEAAADMIDPEEPTQISVGLTPDCSTVDEHCDAAQTACGR